MPANTPNPIGRTSSFLPGRVKGVADAEASAAAADTDVVAEVAAAVAVVETDAPAGVVLAGGVDDADLVAVPISLAGPPAGAAEDVTEALAAELVEEDGAAEVTAEDADELVEEAAGVEVARGDDEADVVAATLEELELELELDEDAADVEVAAAAEVVTAEVPVAVAVTTRVLMLVDWGWIVEVLRPVDVPARMVLDDLTTWVVQLRSSLTMFWPLTTIGVSLIVQVSITVPANVSAVRVVVTVVGPVNGAF